MIPLTVRSYYSLMWGTSSPENICKAAKRLGYKQLALTDTNNLYGLWPFLKSCEKENISPIIGSEITDPASGLRAVCLVENKTGYQSLCRLITRRHQKTDEPFDLTSVLPDYSKGMVVLTRSVSLLTYWRNASVAIAAALPRKPDKHSFELRRVARKLNIPVVATPGSFFLEPDDSDRHCMLRAIDLNTSLSKLPEKEKAPKNSWLASPLEYKKRFDIWPDAIKNTEAIAERLTFKKPANGLILPPWESPSGESPGKMLRQASYKGARMRYGDDLSEIVVNRLEHELQIIDQMDFSSYFLVVRDIVSASPRICGRGSGAASLVSYCLGITNVCPVKHNLYFERFLNPGRLDPPDIDIDFAWDERDDVLNTVLKQYHGHAALVCNHVTFQPRMAIREVAKVFGLTDHEIGSISKRLPWFWHKSSDNEALLSHLRKMPELKESDFSEPWPRIIHMAQRIIGLPRYISVHPGGVIITPNPIDVYVPVEPTPKGVPVIQWEKDNTEDAGLVKIDLLGNRSLGVIRDAVSNIRSNNILFDEQKWEPENDTATQNSIARGQTMGCFYIESPAMRLLQKKTRVGDFEHLVIHSSIIRPAANEFIREYIRRLHGGSWDPIHPLLADVLEETYGIMVYQEDVSRVAVALAGFSHTEADGLRKVMSRKDRELKMYDYKERFTSGARARGVSDEQIEAIWDMMMSFSGYSFCKPHSASYAKVSFQAAYLKTHFPAEFMAAVISNQGGFYSTFAYVSEARRLGLAILPPDINQSDILWKGEGRTIRVGLQAIKHLSANTIHIIVTQRKTGHYQSISDFLTKAQPNEQEARSLVHAGALDSLHTGESRHFLLWELAYQHTSQRKGSDTSGLFSKNTDVDTPSFPPEDTCRRLRHEFTALGFLCGQHPMTLYTDVLKNQNITKAKDMPRFVNKRVRVAGLLVTGKVVHTKHGEPMEFLTFEDETGQIETTFFPKTYRHFCSLLDKNRPFLLSGMVDEDFGAITLTVDHVKPIPKI
ncbi:MAG: DNA polymerase III subunit alpha [Deltaproteobacteria bacterium]|nr:DNA polymerase III subunit alpha [Deltaproteobacteria bacterium]